MGLYWPHIDIHVSPVYRKGSGTEVLKSSVIGGGHRVISRTRQKGNLPESFSGKKAEKVWIWGKNLHRNSKGRRGPLIDTQEGLRCGGFAKEPKHQKR